MAVLLLLMVHACSILAKDPCAHATGLVQAAVDQGSAGDVKAVWKLLQQAVEICPDHPSALSNLGFLNAIWNQHDVVKTLLMKALLQNATMMEAFRSQSCSSEGQEKGGERERV